MPALTLPNMTNNPNQRQHSPATLRNRDPILAVLEGVLPQSGLVLEVASGSGEHAAWFAPRLPALIWQTSAPETESLQSIAAWTDGLNESGGDAGNLPPPLKLDVHDDPWPVAVADAVVCINMVHISPWATTQALLAGAATILPAGGPLYLYGPYLIEGQPTAASNQAFDQDWRRRNPGWGIRDLAAVTHEAARHGFDLADTITMPSNNLSVIFRKNNI